MPGSRFASRVAIVTGAGAADGIGAAVARELVSEGARVLLAATSDRVHDRAAEIGDAAVGLVGDLTVESTAEILVRSALDRWGRLDILVNNAGMTSVSAGWDADGDVAHLSLADWDAAIARNLTTAFLMCRAAVRDVPGPRVCIVRDRGGAGRRRWSQLAGDVAKTIDRRER